MIKKSPAGSSHSTELDEPVGTNLSVVGDRGAGGLYHTPEPTNGDAHVSAKACAPLASPKNYQT